MATITYSEDKTILLEAEDVEGHVAIPQGVKEIGEKAFAGCSSLTSVEIPNSVTSIGLSAFEDCSSLASVGIPNSVTEIGEDSFKGCPIVSYTLAEDNRLLMSKDGVLFTKDGNVLFVYPVGRGDSEYIVPDGTKEICYYAFYDSSLVSLRLPNSIESFSPGIIANFRKLRKIHLRAEDPNTIEISSDLSDDVLKALSRCTLYVPAGSEDAYRHHEVFSKFKKVKIEK